MLNLIPYILGVSLTPECLNAAKAEYNTIFYVRFKPFTTQKLPENKTLPIWTELQIRTVIFKIDPAVSMQKRYKVKISWIKH